jgi:biotin carboxyl carrier protein
MDSFRARIGDREYALTRSLEGTLSVDGHEVTHELLPLGNGRHLLRIGAKSYEVELGGAGEQEHSMLVYVNNRAFVVELDNETTLLLKQIEAGQPTRVHAAVLRAPMPGRISKLLVTQGELVEAGQGIIVLEAMKMENELRAPAAGIVKTVRVKEGDAVEKNALLLELS